MNKAYQDGSKAGMNNVSPVSNPHQSNVSQRLEWDRGWLDGRLMRNKIYVHELALYRHDQARLTMLWG